MKSFVLLTAAWMITVSLPVEVLAEEHEHEHFDIAPYMQDGQLLTAGLAHDGDIVPGPVSVYGYEFGEGADPYNPSDPGVNQQAGVGDLPPGAVLSYNILTDLLYWDGTGEVNYGSPGNAQINLLMGTQLRTLTADSGPQVGSLIQSVLGDGSVHKHFTTSLLASAGSDNVPEFPPGVPNPSFVAPPTGIYAFGLELTLYDGGEQYVSPPLWMVFNNGLDEHAHHEAMEHFVPEPVSLMLLGCGSLALLRRIAG